MFVLAALMAMLLGVAASPAVAGVTAVKGSAYGYYLHVSLFNSPYNDRGPSPTVTLATDASNSPQTATASTGSAAVGPATFFSSGTLTVNSQAVTGPSGSVTSSTSIDNTNTSSQEPLTASNVSSTCTANGSTVTGSTTVTNGTLQTDDGDTTHPAVDIVVPTAPSPNTSYSGINRGTGDSFRYVFNEQVTNPDGSMTVYAAHEYLLGPTAVGDLYIGKSLCGVSTGPAPVNSSPPTISGTPVVVESLSSSQAQVEAFLLTQIVPHGTAARIMALLKHGGYSLSFKAHDAGRILIRWYLVPKGAHLASATPKPVLVASGRRTFAAAGAAQVKIKLTAAGRRLLKHVNLLKLTAKGVFTPAAGTALVALKKFTIKR